VKVRLATAVLTALLAASGLRAQQAQQVEPPVFRVNVEAVEIDVFVTDAQGNPVTDLTADDFELFEEGTRQTITSFSLVHIPIERDTRPLYSRIAVEPDVRSNVGEGRLYVIALDEVRPDLALRTRHFLRRFFEQHFAANDMAAVVYVGRGRARDAQDFTSNRRLLLNAIDRFSGGFSQEAVPPAMVTLDGGPIAGPLSPGPSEADALNRARMRSLRDLLEFMGGLRGRRKTMLYITEQVGDVFSVLDYNGGTRSIAYDDFHAAITAATRGNVSIYPVDPRGLTPEGGLGDAEIAPTVGGAEGLARIQGLRTLADTTGGFAVVNSNSFDEAFTRIVRENSSYYVLGFTSTNERRDGRYRRLRVGVARPGLQVRSRQGYLAPKDRGREPAPPNAAGNVSAGVAEALATPLGAGTVPMRIFAAPYRGEDRNAAVAIAIEIDAAALGLTNRDGTFAGRLEIADTAVAAEGKVIPGDRRYASLTLRPDTYDRVRRHGIRAMLQQQLAPGRYQLRVAAGLSGGSAGSVVAELEVPDFSREPFSMSGVAITSSAAQQALTLPTPNPLEGLLPGPIVTAREFRPDETLTLYTEFYESRRNSAAHTISMKAELRTDAGRVVTTTAEERSSKELKGAAGGYGFLAEIPLKEADPGLYVIHVEAQLNMGQRPVVSRDIPIRVIAEP
jgi:VWFA-related protein